MESKRILALYGNSVYYGHERSNVQVFNLLKDEGLDLLVLTNKSGIAPEAEAVFKNKGIKYESITYPSWSDMRKPIKIAGILRYLYKVIVHNFVFYSKLLKFKPDYIYIANDFMYMSLVPSFILSNKKIIYRLGDAPVTGWKPFKILWEKYIVKRTYRFVCISQFIKDKLVDAGRVRSDKDIIIYNFPPVRTFKDKVAIPFIKQGIVFSYLGQLIDIKGVGLYIDAAIAICNKYEDVSFLLAGDLNYSRGFTDGLIAKVNASGHQGRILFLGSVENIQDLFAKTDVLITPSLKEEPLGNVLVEAKSYYTPSIIFNSGGMPELISHKHNGYVCQESTAAALQTAMQYYIDNKDLIAVHSSNAFASIKELGIGFTEYRENWLGIFK